VILEFSNSPHGKDRILFMKIEANDGTILEVRKCLNDSEWDLLLAESSQNNTFLNSKYLTSSGKEESKRFLLRNDTPVLGFTVPTISNDGTISTQHQFSTYNGLFFIDKISSGYSQDLQRIKVLENLMEYFDLAKIQVQLSLHHSIKDIRGMEWYFFDRQTNLELETCIRYTGLIRLEEFKDFSEYLTTIRKVRVQEYKKSLASSNYQVITSNSADEFCRLYSATFNKHQLQVSVENLTLVKNIIESGIKNGYGKLLMLVNNEGKAISGSYFATDKTSMYYQFGANDPKFLKENGSTRLILRGVENAFAEKKKVFDMVGMNSPLRGEFKASFNARPAPYFETKLSLKAK
jgi:hypothetical protein